MRTKFTRLVAVLCAALILFSALSFSAFAQENTKLVALTFDDGPGPYTEELLDGLAARGAKATFFTVGNRAAASPDILNRIVSEGHQLASHSYNHADLSRQTPAGIQYQIGITNQILADAAGDDSYAVRPPYGAVDADVKAYAGVPLIMWSVDPLDWKYRNTQTVTNNVLSRVQDGDIILLHDIHHASVYAAFNIVDALQAKGYEFVTVYELLLRRGVDIVDGKVYYSARPNGTTYEEANDKALISSHWASKDINYSVQRGLISAFTDGSFRPNYSMSRGAFAAALGKLYEQTGGKTANPDDTFFEFTDVPANAQYAKYVQWAANAGIMTGHGDGTFGYYGSITREQISTCIVRYLDYVGVKSAATGTFPVFGDADQIAGWALEGVNYCSSIGIFKGNELGNFDPKGKMTRAQAAAVLQRLDAIDGNRYSPVILPR